MNFPKLLGFRCIAIALLDGKMEGFMSREIALIGKCGTK
jgi:hypothetical protein